LSELFVQHVIFTLILFYTEIIKKISTICIKKIKQFYLHIVNQRYEDNGL
jgi:hypothetical protein